MADRYPVHQPTDGEGQLVPTVKHYKLPLLPFERELIELAGITEAEYRHFVAESIERAKIRPAEYDLIPEINNATPTGLEIVLINLAVGLLTSAVSFLLAPKPRAPDPPVNRRLADIKGQDVFAPTSGFDSLAALANYNEPIPIIFGRYTGSTGGVVISPKLVWSRAFSYGLEQSVKLLFVVGEEGVGSIGIARPDLSGIFLGNTPLDAAFDHKFAFYWRAKTFNNTSRIAAQQLRYGTRGTIDSGDPELNNDIFTAPTRTSAADTAFCMSYVPTSNTQFGAFSPVYNGTDYRVNWRVVPILKLPDIKDDPQNALLLERVKIAGSFGINVRLSGVIADRRIVANAGQPGVGRGYCRCMGLVSVNATTVTDPSGLQTVPVTIGSIATFRILGNDLLPQNYYYIRDGQDIVENVKVDDINSEIASQKSAADAILQLGETIQIGYTLWVVTRRSSPVLQPPQTQDIQLRCVEFLGLDSDSRQVGIVSDPIILKGQAVGESILTYGPNEGDGPKVPTDFYPLMRTQLATIRNSRPCDSTEIGIRSQVWNRASGLCSFESLPTPADLFAAEKARVAITSGVQTRYFKRTSVFSLQIRPAGNDSTGNPFTWTGAGPLLCVTGDQPVDIYNFIRIEHPNRQQYEFRLVPRPGANITNGRSLTTQLWQLDARQTGAPLSQTFTVSSYGNFRITTPGKIVTIADIKQNREMVGEGRVFEASSQLSDVSFYSGLLQKSNESAPEHTVSYVNEITRNDAGAPNYTNITTAGLALKASRTYNTIDQIRVWKDDGIPVLRFHPDEAGTTGASNLLTDLVYYLLTDRVAGAGASVYAAQIKTADFAVTARFLRTNKLFFDGAIVDPVNIREFITATAPFFLCNFVISDGLFSLVPAVPTTVSGSISTGAVPIKGLFTGGNILEDTFRVEYINAEERNNIQAIVRYREGVKNQLPQERTLNVRWNEAGSTGDKIETFDLTQYCTSRDHASLAARYILSVRRRITHTVTFKTTPQGISLAPGNYIRVVTTASPYSGANNGVIGSAGQITSATPLPNGTYSINFYRQGDNQVNTGVIAVTNNTTANQIAWNSIFTVTTSATSSNVYMVEQLSLDAEGMVEIVASEFKTDASFVSQIARDLTTASTFITEG